MNHSEKTPPTHLPVSLSSTSEAGALRNKDGLLAGTLTVHCPVTAEQVLLQRCAFCARSDGLFLDPSDGSLTQSCRLPAD